MKREVKFKVNGIEYHLEVRDDEKLLDVLRDRLDITSPKRGCEMGECGACTVVMEGRAVNSCLVLAAECQGKEIFTVESLKKNGKLHPLQQAFIDKGAVQCGFCTPGMIMSAYALLKENPNPSEGDIKEAISGNICRCTGYKPIVDAIKEAAVVMRKEGQ